jgi:hypothetical protein
MPSRRHFLTRLAALGAGIPVAFAPVGTDCPVSGSPMGNSMWLLVGNMQ